MLMDVLYHTAWLKFVVLLHVLATLCAVLMFWVAQRGTGRPQPKLQLLW
jgi:hypothetical protein